MTAAPKLRPEAARHNILRGDVIAAEIIADVKDKVVELARASWPVKIVSVTIGEVPAARLYVRNQARAAQRAGIAFEERNFEASVTMEEVLASINSLNTNPGVTGVIIQRPVPAHLGIREIQAAVHPLKDVEGLHPRSIGNIVYGDLAIAPCTAKASVELLKRTGLRLEGLEVVVIGHSEIVGKPIAFLLMAEGATVTVCHQMTRSVAMHSRAADAVFVAVGRARLVSHEMIKPGAAVIDIGINQVEQGGRTITVGDVDFEPVADIAGWITPVPGGVGPVTVAMLMRNALTAARAQKNYYDRFFTDRTGLEERLPMPS
jgi:methylenetetrahydrofolate dehydrogenase (NADP+) / methenyltetrahydrofolate cyclohydrolase